MILDEGILGVGSDIIAGLTFWGFLKRQSKYPYAPYLRLLPF